MTRLRKLKTEVRKMAGARGHNMDRFTNAMDSPRHISCCRNCPCLIGIDQSVPDGFPKGWWGSATEEDCPAFAASR